MAATLPCLATTYYVDSALGTDSDSNPGLTESKPWLTLAKVNAAPLLPGDRVLFKRGGTWHGSLTLSRPGKPGAPIHFGSYGDPQLPKPTLHGGGTTEATLFIANSASHIVVDGFHITNFDGADLTDGSEARRSGIQIGTWLGSQQNIQILNNEVERVEGCSNHPTLPARGRSAPVGNDHQYSNAAIYGCAKFSDQLLIAGNLVHDCTTAGISIVANREEINGIPTGQTTRLVIQDNAVVNVGSDGILVVEASSPLIQRNSCVGAGNNSGANPPTATTLGRNGIAVAGIWSKGCTSPLFQYNYCQGTRKILYDGHAWDFDLETDGTAIYQFNYSRDNEGGFALASHDPTSSSLRKIFRYNISVNDGSRQDADGQGFFIGTADYSNNLFFRTDGQGYKLDNAPNCRVTGNFTNNIFFARNATTHITYQDPAATERHFSHNNFSGHTPLHPGNHPLLADPLFTDPSDIHPLPPGVPVTHSALRRATRGLMLLPASPLKTRGLALPSPPADDFWGSPLLPTHPPIGPDATP